MRVYGGDPRSIVRELKRRVVRTDSMKDRIKLREVGVQVRITEGIDV